MGSFVPHRLLLALSLLSLETEYVKQVVLFGDIPALVFIPVTVVVFLGLLGTMRFVVTVGIIGGVGFLVMHPVHVVRLLQLGLLPLSYDSARKEVSFVMVACIIPFVFGLGVYLFLFGLESFNVVLGLC